MKTVKVKLKASNPTVGPIRYQILSITNALTLGVGDHGPGSWIDAKAAQKLVDDRRIDVTVLPNED